MKFRSNHLVAIHLPDLRKAETFYSGVLNFRLLTKTPSQLEYDTGHFVLRIHKATKVSAPVPSLSVISAREARQLLEQHGCEILSERGDSLNFKDPFGVIYDLVED